MTRLEQNETYTYTCVGHPARTEADGAHYCRAVRTKLTDYDLCADCPLYGGESTTLYHESAELDPSNSDARVPMCYYYDLEFGDAEVVDGATQSLRTEAFIQADLIPRFPYYLTEFQAIRQFGIMEEAIQFAAEKHEGQTRKGSKKPYICHPVEVMMLVAKMTPDAEVAAAAALHDTIEDTDTTYEELKDRFGKRIAGLVQSESEDKRPGMPKSESWHIRKEENIAHVKTESREAKMIMLADKLSNIRASYKEYQQFGDEIFQKFNVKDKSEHSWYFHGIVDALQELKDLPQYSELKSLVNEIFGE